MYAVFRTGGKQYRASEGDRLRVEKLDAEEGADVRFEEVLLVGEGGELEVGTPTVAGAAVNAKVLRQGKTRKIPVVKFRRRQNYLRQGSHRQFFTEVEITSIGGKSGAKPAPAAKENAVAGAGRAASAAAPAKKASPGKKKASKKKTSKKKTGKKTAKKTSG